MYFSLVKTVLNEDNFKELARHSGQVYRAHQWLWKLFPGDEEAKRDFLFREEYEGALPRFYLLSERKPLPRTTLFTLETREYKPVLAEGERFLFKLRMNPVVARKREEGTGSAKHDIWMDYKHEGRRNRVKKEDLQSYTTGMVRKWFSAKSPAYGFTVGEEDVSVSRYSTHRFRKQSRGKTISFASLDFEGILTVTDCELFLQKLYTGVGRARAFGCGLMLIKRV